MRYYTFISMSAICVTEMACVSPFQAGRIAKESQLLNSPLPPAQEQRLSKLIENQIKFTPQQIGNWTLQGCEVLVNTGASPETTHVIFGKSIIAKFINNKNQYAVARMYINPIELGYGDLGNGGYKFADSHAPAVYIWNKQGEYLLKEDHCGFTIDFETKDLGLPYDLNILREYKYVIGHIGKEWKRKSIRKSSTFLEQDWFRLPISVASWREQITGEYWIISAPTHDDTRDIALALLEKQRPILIFK